MRIVPTKSFVKSVIVGLTADTDVEYGRKLSFKGIEELFSLRDIVRPRICSGNIRTRLIRLFLVVGCGRFQRDAIRFINVVFSSFLRNLSLVR